MPMPLCARVLLRLSMIALASTIAVAPLAAQANGGPGGDADEAALDNYKLTLPVLGKLEKAFSNTLVTLKAHPELAKTLAAQDTDDDANTFDEMVAKLDEFPQIKAGVIKSGFTPREYTLALLTMFQASIVAALPGPGNSSLPANAMTNAAFIRAHPAEFARVQALGLAIEKLTSPARPDSSAEAPDTLHTPR